MGLQLVGNLFYAWDSRVFLCYKPAGVVRYQIFISLQPLKQLNQRKWIHSFRKGEVLEVTTEGLERYFYQYDFSQKEFKELRFPSVSEEMEGEAVLKKHLGL